MLLDKIFFRCISKQFTKIILFFANKWQRYLQFCYDCMTLYWLRYICGRSLVIQRMWSYFSVVGLTLIFVASLPDSNLLASVTLLPKRQYLGIVTPTTPARTVPVCNPMRIWNMKHPMINTTTQCHEYICNKTGQTPMELVIIKIGWFFYKTIFSWQNWLHLFRKLIYTYSIS